MITAVDECVEYVLEADRESEEPTVFLIKTLDVSRFMRISAIIQRMFEGGKTEERDVGRLGPFFDACLQAGLAGWRNLKDAQGGEVPFEGAKSLVRLRPLWRAELARAVAEHNGLSEAERKN